MLDIREVKKIARRNSPVSQKLNLLLIAIKKMTPSDDNFVKALIDCGREGFLLEYLDNYFPTDSGQRLYDIVKKNQLLSESYIAGYSNYIQKCHKMYMENLYSNDAKKPDIDKWKVEYEKGLDYISKLRKDNESDYSNSRKLLKPDDGNFFEMVG